MQQLQQLPQINSIGPHRQQH